MNTFKIRPENRRLGSKFHNLRRALHIYRHITFYGAVKIMKYLFYWGCLIILLLQEFPDKI